MLPAALVGPARACEHQGEIRRRRTVPEGLTSFGGTSVAAGEPGDEHVFGRRLYLSSALAFVKATI
jgi:hypothetical protein